MFVNYSLFSIFNILISISLPRMTIVLSSWGKRASGEAIDGNLAVKIVGGGICEEGSGFCFARI